MLQGILHRHQLMQTRGREGFVRHPIHQRVDDGFVQSDPPTVHPAHLAHDLLHHVDLEVRGRFVRPMAKRDLAVAEDKAVLPRELLRYTNGLLLRGVERRPVRAVRVPNESSVSRAPFGR